MAIIYNLRDFLRALNTRDYAAMPSIRALCASSPLFQSQVQRVVNENPKPYAELGRRLVAQERLRHRGQPGAMGNVHDPLLAGPRRATKDWLSHQEPARGFTQVSLGQHYDAKEIELLGYVAQADLPELDQAILQRYIPFFFSKYREGATGALNLFQAMALLDSTTEGLERGSAEDLQDRREKLAPLLEGLLGAAKGYEGETKKYYPPYDYSCMPGLDERVLDALTGVRLSLTAEAPDLEQGSAIDAYVAQCRDPFVTRDAIGPKPTAFLYRLYLDAAYPTGFTEELRPMTRVHLAAIDSEPYHLALSVYKAEVLANIQEYQKMSLGLSRLQKTNTQKALGIAPYFDNREEIGLSNTVFLEGTNLDAAITAKFNQAVTLYHEQALEGDRKIPEFLRSLVIEERTIQQLCYEGEIASREETLARLQRTLGFEHDYMESVLLMSGGSEDSLLGSLESWREAGVALREDWREPEVVAEAIAEQTELREAAAIHLPLGYGSLQLADNAVFQTCFQGLLNDEDVLNPQFIASERQYIANLPWLENHEALLKGLLFRAAELGHLDFIKAVLERHPDWIFATDDRVVWERRFESTLLHTALRERQKHIFDYLLHIEPRLVARNPANMHNEPHTGLLAIALQNNTIEYARALIHSPEGLGMLESELSDGDSYILNQLVSSSNIECLREIVSTFGGHASLQRLFVSTNNQQKSALDRGLFSNSVAYYGDDPIEQLATFNTDRAQQKAQVYKLLIAQGCPMQVNSLEILYENTFLAPHGMDLLKDYCIYNHDSLSYMRMSRTLLMSGIILPHEHWEFFQEIALLRSDLERNILSAIEYGDANELSNFSIFIVKQVIDKYGDTLDRSHWNCIERAFPHAEIEIRVFPVEPSLNPTEALFTENEAFYSEGKTLLPSCTKSLIPSQEISHSILDNTPSATRHR